MPLPSSSSSWTRQEGWHLFRCLSNQCRARFRAYFGCLLVQISGYIVWCRPIAFESFWYWHCRVQALIASLMAFIRTGFSSAIISATNFPTENSIESQFRFSAISRKLRLLKTLLHIYSDGSNDTVFHVHFICSARSTDAFVHARNGTQFHYDYLRSMYSFRRNYHQNAFAQTRLYGFTSSTSATEYTKSTN